MNERKERERETFPVALRSSSAALRFTEREGGWKNVWGARGKHAAREGGRLCEGE